VKIQFSKQEKIDILENTIAWIVVFMMLVYGCGKINQFSGAISVAKTLPELTGMELMWAFYGYSLPYALIIGFLEVTGALLIFYKRTRIIGCFLTSAILVNVILQIIFFEVLQGALITAIILQISTLIVLWMNKCKVIEAYQTLTKPTKPSATFKKRILAFGITFVLFVVLWFLQHYLTSFISHSL
jgi:hypothetical protein